MEIQPPPKSTPNTTWKILIIDDDEDDFLIARTMLNEAKGRKYTVHWAATYAAGREALISDHYNAVLVDYDLGLHSGIEFIREANERGYPGPLILFTGRGNYEVDVEAMQAGATLYLTKGEVNPLLLERAIRYAIELKQKEQALRDSEAALRISEAKERAKVAEMDAILEAVPAIVWETHDPQAREVTGNRAAYEYHGVPLGKNISMSAPNDMPQTLRAFKDGKELAPEELPLQLAAASGKPLRNFEEEFVFKDGRQAYLLGNVSPLLDEDGNPCGAVAAFIDITERKLMEEALQISEERFYKAFNANPNAQVISHQEDGRIEVINDSFEQLFGYKREEVLGKTSLELNMFTHPADREEAVGRLRADQFLRDFEVDIQTKAGEIRRVTISVEMITIGGEMQMLSVFQDITGGKQVEEALRESEEKFRSLFENSIDAVFLTIPDGSIAAANPAACAMLGWSEQEICGLGRAGVLDVDDPRLADALEERQRTGRIQRQELTAIRKCGERFPVEVDSVILSVEPVRSFVIMRDISERKAAEEELRKNNDALREREEVLRLALTAGKAGAWSWDLITNTMQWSDEFYRIFGYEPGSIPPSFEAGMSHVHPEDRPRIETELQEAIDHGKQVDTIHQVIWPDGSVHWVRGMSHAFYSPEGRPYRMAGIAIDVTQQKRAEEALRESEAHFRHLADLMPHLVWTAKADGILDFINQRYQEFDGISPTDSEQWEWWPVLHPDDLQPTITAWDRAVQTGDDYQIDHRARMKDGAFRWHLSRGLPIKDGEGNVLRWLGTSTDIDDQKRYEARILRSNQELEQFAFIASHDLQEPLRKIKTFSTCLRRELSGNLSEEVEDSLDRMMKAAERMQIMIDGLLELSRVNTHGGTFAPIQLTQVAKEAMFDLETRIQSTGGLVHINDLPSIEADELQMRQLFQNLIGNALKFHKPDVPPDVRVSGTFIKSDVKPSVIITVIDNGIGFDPQYTERIFQPFQRLHGMSEYEGTGLGLAICQKIVERHQGQITVRSEPGVGSTFMVRLPLRQCT